MKHLNEFEKQMLLYRINNLSSLGNKDFMTSFAGIVNDFDLLKKDDFENLQDHDWCRDTFKHEYTIIKPLSKSVSDLLVEEKRDNTGRQRYYDNVFYLGGKNVLLSSEWYDGKGRKQDNKTNFVNWLRNLVNERYSIGIENSNIKSQGTIVADYYMPYLTALRTKPFMLLAGNSGTGKSRIVREMAKACWKEGDEEFGKNCPRNFCMVQVKPNWHDSSELIGYVSRLNGEKFVVGPFLRFLSAALKEPKVPYFLCLDEMNLAPVEQYFAEYLSVIESRKVNKDPVSGQTIIETDPIIKPSDNKEYNDLIGKLLGDEERMKGTTLTIPQNLFVVGTVNMDETTFSFSRKVLDRAMTIEMNEVDLHGGLAKGSDNEIGYIADSIIGDAAEGSDVYEENKELCDQVLAYLEQVNAILEGSPFKIAYRTRNEFLMYAVNRRKLAPDSQLWQTLDEMTSMKILSRIEGDSDRTKNVLERLKALVEEEIVAKMNNITGLAPSHPVDTGEAPVLPSKTGEVPVHPSDTGETPVFPGVATIFPSKTGETPVLRKSISAKKIEEMLAKLEGTGFTSYWA